MQYPIVIHKDPDSEYGVTVPDLPGCFSAGTTLENAILNAQEAIECHLEGLLLDKETLPRAKSIATHMHKKEYKEGVWAVVQINPAKISGKCQRINITLPARFLKQIDSFAAKHGHSRSAFLMDAAMDYIASHS